MPPTAILLMGIQGSGKSTLFKQRWADTHVRINRDMLKTSNRFEALVFACLSTSQPFVLDNTHVHVAGRRRYLALARAAGFRVEGYFFEPDLEGCLRRNAQRKTSVPEKAIYGTKNKWEAPTSGEGFDALYRVKAVEDPERFAFDIQPLPGNEQDDGQDRSR